MALQARNEEDKSKWCQCLKKLILDNYDVEIPSSAKHSLLMLASNHCLQRGALSFFLLSCRMYYDIYAARCYACTGYSVMQCVSVCLSRSYILSKRINISSKCFHRWVATKIRAVLTGRLTVSGFDLAWFSSLSSKHLCVFGLNGAI